MNGPVPVLAAAATGLADWTRMGAAIAGLTVITVVTRGAFGFLPRSVKLTPRLERALRYAPACALAAIVAPEVFTEQGEVLWTLHNPKLWACVVAGAVFGATRSMIAMMAVGMAVFTALRLWW